MSTPIISCITPTFNRVKLLKRAIESTISQTYPHWEMIIVDDGSKDNTKQVAEEYVKKDSRIKYFKNPGKGANAARNFGIKQSKGKYIVFLDDDDEHLPHRFDSQLKAALKSGNHFILSGYQTKNKNGKITAQHAEGLWARGAGIGIRWLVSKELIIKAGLFDETMPAMQEIELSYRISNFETFSNHKDVIVTAYNTPNSISKGVNGLKGAELVLKKHIDKMPPLEAAWWNFTIGKGYYSLNEIEKALKHLTLAAKLDERGIYRIAYWYLKLFNKLDNIGLIKKINLKILIFFSTYKYPKLVDHRVIE